MASLQRDKETLTSKVSELEGETKKLRRELEDEKERSSGIMREVGVVIAVVGVVNQWGE